MESARTPQGVPIALGSEMACRIGLGTHTERLWYQGVFYQFSSFYQNIFMWINNIIVLV